MKDTESSFVKAGSVIDLIALAMIWCVAVAVVNPVGNFPLNDDWSYAVTVKYLREHWDFRPCGWTCMPFISQALWGALFCLPHGFSFTALRFSTLALSLIGILGLYVLLRQLRQSRPVAFVCALVLAFNPVYFVLSNSFMTDVPFTTMAIFSLLFFVRYFQTESAAMLWVATILVIIATLCRHLGLAIPMAFTATLLLKHGFQRRGMRLAFMPSVLTVGSWLAFNLWLAVTGRTPAIYNQETNKLLNIVERPWTVPLHLAHHGWNALMYLGCFLLPLLVLFLPASKQFRPSRWTKAALVLFFFWSAARFIAKPGLMPVHGNILDQRGIGPFLLKDTQLLNLPDIKPLPVWFWVVVTILSLAGAALLIYYGCNFLNSLFSANESIGAQPKPESAGSTSGWRRALTRWEAFCRNRLEPTDRTIAVFFLVCFLIYLAPLVISGFFDRYMIPAIVLLMAFLAVATRASENSPRRWQWVGLTILLVCSAGYAVAGTRDYLTWNRVRWTALVDLEQNHIPPESIDGGFEFNAWHFYDPKYKPSGDKSGWWVLDDEYLLSFGELPGFEPFKEYKYTRWLPPSEGKILVLKRKDSEQNPAK